MARINYYKTGAETSGHIMIWHPTGLPRFIPPGEIQGVTASVVGADHGDLSGLGDDDHPQYVSHDELDASGFVTSAGTDHGGLTGLTDDDHPQYIPINANRGWYNNLAASGWLITHPEYGIGINTSVSGFAAEATDIAPLSFSGASSLYTCIYGGTGASTYICAGEAGRRNSTLIDIIDNISAADESIFNFSDEDWYVYVGLNGGWPASHIMKFDDDTGTLTINGSSVAVHNHMHFEIRDVTHYATPQDAVKEVEALGGGIVYFPPGDHTFDEPLIVPAGVHLKGAGYGTVFKKSYTDTTANWLILFDDSHRSGMSDILIDGEDVANDPGLNGGGVNAIQIQGASSELVFKNIKVQDWGADADGNAAWNDGFYIGSGGASNINNYIWIDNCNFNDVTRNGISIVNGRWIWVTDSNFKEFFNSSIDIEPNPSGITKDIFVCRNHIYDTDGPGLVVTGATHHETDGTGGDHHAVARVHIIENTISGSLFRGLATYEMKDSLVYGNVIMDSGEIGLDIRHAHNCKYSHNTIEDTVNAGISVGQQQSRSWNGPLDAPRQLCEDLDISHNTVIRSGADGIVIAPGASGLIKNISAIHNKTIDCGVAANNRYGIKVAGSASGYVRIESNQCIVNENAGNFWGVMLDDDAHLDNVFVRDNYTEGHTTAGFYQGSTIHGTLSYGGNIWTEGTTFAASGYLGDHGELDGLADDDHIAYPTRDGSRGFDGTLSVSGHIDIESGYDLRAYYQGTPAMVMRTTAATFGNAISFHAGSRLAVSAGEAYVPIEANTDPDVETLHLGGDDATHLYSNLQSGTWGDRHEWDFKSDGRLVVDPHDANTSYLRLDGQEGTTDDVYTSGWVLVDPDVGIKVNAAASGWTATGSDYGLIRLSGASSLFTAIYGGAGASTVFCAGETGRYVPGAAIEDGQLSEFLYEFNPADESIFMLSDLSFNVHTGVAANTFTSSHHLKWSNQGALTLNGSGLVATADPKWQEMIGLGETILHTHPAGGTTADYSDISANDSDTDVTGLELERLTNGGDVSMGTELHHHDNTYYTQDEIDASGWIYSPYTGGLQIIQGNLTGIKNLHLTAEASAITTAGFLHVDDTASLVAAGTPIVITTKNSTAFQIQDSTPTTNIQFNSNGGMYLNFSQNATAFFEQRGSSVVALYKASAANDNVSFNSTTTIAGPLVNVYAKANLDDTSLGDPTNGALRIYGSSTSHGIGSMTELQFAGESANISRTGIAPTSIGYETKSVSGGGYGNLYLSTRDVATETAPTIRMKIHSNGTIDCSGNIISHVATPTNDHEVATKGYVDGKQKKITFTIEDPTATDDVTLSHFDAPVTIDRVVGVIIGTNWVAGKLQHHTDRTNAGNAVFDGAGVEQFNQTTIGNDITSFNDNTVPSGWLWYEGSAIDGTPDQLHLSIYYTED